MLGSDLGNTRWKAGSCEVDQARQFKILVALRRSLVLHIRVILSNQLC